jgi:fatty-acyl-CoA synthase
MVAAVGKPDRYAGELPVAYVQLREGRAVTEAELKTFAAAQIGEGAAVPQDIHIIDEMPLTDVRKVAKAALRQDAIRRVFASALRDAIGKDVRVLVAPHPVHGTLVTILLPAAQRQECERRAEDAMRGYTVRTLIEWFE